MTNFRISIYMGNNGLCEHEIVSEHDNIDSLVYSIFDEITEGVPYIIFQQPDNKKLVLSSYLLENTGWSVNVLQDIENSKIRLN